MCYNLCIMKYTDKEVEINRAKQKLFSKRRRLLKKLLKTYQMVSGLSAIYRRCGKPGCRCQTTYRHGPAWCLHYKEEDKIKMLYIPAKYLDKVKRQAEDYKRYKDIGKEIGKINRRILELQFKKD